jgi:Notch-like protein
MMKLHLLTTLLISLATSITGETCPDTSVQCAKQEITCATGPADFSDHPKDFFGEEFMFHRTKELEGYHCVCPEGLTGLRCARPFEKCDAGHFCYHGGECIPGMSSTDPNDLFCDCQKAEHNGDPYAGKFCEVQLQKCGSDSEIFCARSGQCKPDFEDKLRPCVCPQGIRGPHCEFYDDHVPNCKLECQNDGLCTRGIKSYDTALYNGFWAQNDGNFQHCECKEGFYGLTCEAEAVACGESQCFHGGTCVQTLNSKNKAIFACDCNTAKAEGASWAGQYCQSKATNYCSKDVDQNGQLFCANNGDCKDEA